MPQVGNFAEENIHIDPSLRQTWLSQFDSSDQPIARFLLDSILYISNDQLISGLRELVLTFMKDIATGPIALFAARENTGETYWRRDSRPRSVHGRQPVGSEGILSHLIRDLTQSNNSVLDHPSIMEMREAKCRHILCLDDMIGSGSRMISFAEWLYKNRAICSWHSFKYIAFTACAYCASITGEERVNRSRLYSAVYQVQPVASGRSIWTQDQRAAVQELCIKYAQYTRKPDWPLGFQNGFTAIIFSHSCPNTNPAILWASKRGSWIGIFDQRPEFVVSGIPKLNLKLLHQKRILNALGHTRLIKPSLFDRLSTESRQLLLLLSCLAARRFRENTLSDILELPLPVIRRQIAQCITYKWIDDTKHLTQLGKNVLIAARRNHCIPSKDVDLRNDFYYPKSLRSPEGSSS